MAEITAKDIMNREVKTVEVNTKLNDVVELLVTNNISGVPVVDGDGKLAGIISEADLIDQSKREWAIPAWPSSASGRRLTACWTTHTRKAAH